MPREDYSVGASPGYVFKRQPNYLAHIWNEDGDLTDRQAMRMYTMETHYKQINQSLRTDSLYLANNSEMIGAMRRAIRCHREHGTVYRGVRLSAKQVSAYTEGFKFLWPAFTSTSRDRAMAREFGTHTQGEIKVMFIIDLDGPGVTYARNISKFSYYPSEDEVVIYPYSGFEVTGSAEMLDGEVCIFLRTYDTLLIEKESPDTPDFQEAMAAIMIMAVGLAVCVALMRST